MKQLISNIARVFRGGPTVEAQESWMAKRFIPAYRRMIDAIDGRATIPRARRTVDSLKAEGIGLMKTVPAPMRRSFDELESVIMGNITDPVSIEKVREAAEDQLDTYFLDRRPNADHQFA